MARIFHNPTVREDAAPNANSEVDTASPKTAESVSTRVGQVFTKIFATVVCEQAWQYMNSYPGKEPRGCIISYHSRFGRLAQGIVDCEDSLEEDSKVLCYRLSMIKLATEWKDCLDLPMVDAHLFDVIPWFEGLGEFTEANTPWPLYCHIHYLILRANIFDRPVGTFYYKPVEYLAIALCESDRSLMQISRDIEKLKVLSKKRRRRRARRVGRSESGY